MYLIYLVVTVYCRSVIMPANGPQVDAGVRRVGTDEARIKVHFSF